MRIVTGCWKMVTGKIKSTRKKVPMRVISFFAVIFSMLLIAGCTQKKLDPDELICALKASGCTIEKAARIHHALEGAQAAFWINVDGKRVAAYQYSMESKAKLRATTFQSGIYAGYWAFEFADETTAEKIKKALKQ